MGGQGLTTVISWTEEALSLPLAWPLSRPPEPSLCPAVRGT